jgi:hypothetical protein
MLAAVFMETGCRENTLINAKVAPANSEIGVWSTSLACITHTHYDDTVITSINIGGLSIYQGVGAISDPFFGTMAGATFFQVVPSQFKSDLYDNNATIDSAVLVLPYSGYTYGDSTDVNQTQSYQVFYLDKNDSLGYNTTYYSYSTKPVDVTPLSDPTEVNLHSLTDTFSANGVVYTKGMRIKLNLPALLNYLKPAQAKLTLSTDPTADFINLFKGVCVRATNPATPGKAFPYFRLDGPDVNSEAAVKVYYHHASPLDTLVENYYFNTGSCAHFNGITKSYAGFPVNDLFQSTQPNDSIIALQNQPGASIDIVIPGISKLPAGVINKAELQLSLLPAYNANSFLSIPEKLYPLGIANGTYPSGYGAGIAYNVADRYPLTSLSPLGVLDGYIHTFTRGGKTIQTYTIDLPREVMTSIAAKNDTIHLHINGTQDFYGAFHLVAGGGSYPDTLYRPRLFIVYSKLK